MILEVRNYTHSTVRDIGYSNIINLLDYAACTLPVTVVDKNVDIFEANYQPRNSTDEANWKSCESPFLLFLYFLPEIESSPTCHVFPADHRFILLLDDAEIFDGAHVSVQVVARRLQEEKVLTLTEIIANALNKV